MPHIAFPSIDQFRNAIKAIRQSAEWHQKPVPTLKAVGTVKLHGSNHGVCRPANGDANQIWTQSRERVTTPEQDNAGSSIFTYARRDWFNRFFDALVNSSEIKPTDDMVVQVYGEFCCGNVQKGVGLSQIKDKKFIIFRARISTDAASSEWISKERINQAFDDANDLEGATHVHTIFQFPMYEVEVDFSNPEVAQNKMIEITNDIEKDCPVARSFLPNYEGELIGEGAVWQIDPEQATDWDVSSICWKVKGEKHSSSKVKVLAAVDVEKVASVNEFVEYAVTTNRMEQFIQKIKDSGLEIEAKNTGEFIRLIMADIMKEELDTLASSGLTTKDVTGKIASTARQFFMNYKG